MNPVAFSLFGISIRWYGILISTGMILAIIIAKYNCKWRDVNYDDLLNIIILAIPIGIVGARIYYVLFQFQDYKGNFLSMLNIRQGGLAIHGGLIFGILTAIIYTQKKKMHFLSVADVAAPSIIIAQAIGRWGNFFNQEAYGREVSYSYISHFPKFIQNGMHIYGKYYHPTFLYESMWNLLIFIILLIFIRKSKKRGFVIFSYLGLYSIGRFFIEGLRTDSLMLGPIRVAQLVSILGIALYLVFIIKMILDKNGRK
ncbi:prolipoprotein diacylglyceryl transferase [Clostridium oryzae]|uniref:Phosphatidylglycerol--prolipoprotein diacylglyceryl transferase n=1 Tax=Clostridium oryzae TaxID=1450648 RepID=A0A1V4IJK6_9CLOT|nr:prolipoprotein diacylglyceryl transferase [Clostridium oryzae]OPJ60089.1 prolipoprotein diacylglyceryl transferase [Clostridium oryzae]